MLVPVVVKRTKTVREEAWQLFQENYNHWGVPERLRVMKMLQDGIKAAFFITCDSTLRDVWLEEELQ